MATEPIVAECALVAIGLPAVLDMAPKWGVGVRERADAVPRQIARLIGTFLTGATPQKVGRSLPAFDYDQIRQTLDELEGNAAAVTETLLSAIDDSDLAGEVVEVGTRITLLCRALLPRNVRTEITGDVVEPPAPTSAARFARSWAVACDPLVAFQDLTEWCLAPSQVTDLEHFYPALLDFARARAVATLVAIKGGRAKWSLDMARDAQLRLLLGAERRDLGLAADMQALYASPAAAAPKPRTGGTLDLKTDMGTPGQEQR